MGGITEQPQEQQLPGRTAFRAYVRTDVTEQRMVYCTTVTIDLHYMTDRQERFDLKISKLKLLRKKDTYILDALEGPFETSAAGFKLALCGMWRRFVADEGYLGHGDPYHPTTCVRGSSNQELVAVHSGIAFTVKETCKNLNKKRQQNPYLLDHTFGSVPMMPQLATSESS
ncbi:hypothetical protein PO909_023286 [Leuciscus waleckii]